MESPKISHAIISVSDKAGLIDFAQQLVQCGIEIYSTGGTARHLRTAGVAVTEVSEYTEFPEILEGRVKTLHPKVFAGILARRDHRADLQTLGPLGIQLFELVVVNLYPFAATIALPGVTDEQAIEQIDIGGPSLIRAAAKNSEFVTVATSPDQYPAILSQLQQNGRTSLQLRRELMTDAFKHTANYDALIADYFTPQKGESAFPSNYTLPLKRESKLRYGENHHQKAALYSVPDQPGPNLVQSRQLHGKELSYNNLLDLDAATSILQSFDGPACSVIKHTNPCGVAISRQLATACEKAFASDPQSAFGSVMGVNQRLDLATAEYLVDDSLFIEAILAPEFDEEALDLLTTKPKWRANVRLIEIGSLEPADHGFELRQVQGGFLMQTKDQQDHFGNWKTVTEPHASPDERTQLEFAWRVVRHVKSNAIVLAQQDATTGIGAGQMSRVDAVNIAIDKAGDRAAGSVLASDAFFPFPDSIERAAQAGIRAIVQPGGSKKDDEVVAAGNQLKLAMIFTGRRHFKH